MMKTLHISPYYKPAYQYGGPIMSIPKLCESLVKAGHSAEVLTTTANGKTELRIEVEQPVLLDGVTVHYFKRLSKDPTHFSPALLWHLLQRPNRKNAHVIVHLHSWWNMVAVLCCLIAKLKNIPVILSPRGMLTTYTFNHRNSAYKFMLHQLIGKPLLMHCHIHAGSEQEKQDLLQIIKPKSITVIPNLMQFPNQQAQVTPSQLTISTYDKPAKDEETLLRILFLSRIEEKKGLDILFYALVRTDFKWHLTIAGTGEQTYILSLRKLAERLHISEFITWKGHVGDEVTRHDENPGNLINLNDMENLKSPGRLNNIKPVERKFKLLSVHDILVLPSHNESFGNVVLESLMVGTAVVISDKVGLAGYIHQKKLGWISNLTISDFAAALNAANKAHEERSRIRKKAPEIIKADFSEGNLISQYLLFYKSILGK